MRRPRWGVLHEARVRVHIAAVAMVRRAGGYLWIIVVRGERRLWRRWPQVGGPVVLRSHVGSWSHPRPVSSPLLVERHGCPKTNSAPGSRDFNIALVHTRPHRNPRSFNAYILIQFVDLRCLKRCSASLKLNENTPLLYYFKGSCHEENCPETKHRALITFVLQRKRDEAMKPRAACRVKFVER